jgi:uroporphyrinogen decarboxylase
MKLSDFSRAYKTKNRGGYALGTGNSIPEYVPNEKYFAMISVALEG